MHRALLPTHLCLAALLLLPASALAQGSATLGSGLSAAATARGGITVTQSGSPLDAMQGNPAGLADASGLTLDLSAVGLYADGHFHNAANPDARLRGLAGAMPSGAILTPLGHSRWVAAAAISPEILMRANWHYNDSPGTLGVNYGYQQNEDEIIAVRGALGLARPITPHLSAGISLGLVVNHNDLNAPFIFQQQPSLAGLKVLLKLSTQGYGWNGGAGLEWHPDSRFRAGIAWKSGTTLRTQGTATGSASALFTTLGVASDPTFAYHATVQNHLPQGAAAGLSWRSSRHLTLSGQADFTAWGQAFQELPVTLTNGSNTVINSVAGTSTLHDAVPLHWRNQQTLHAGLEAPLTESVVLRAGYSWANDPVPAATLIPLTAAIMQQSLAAGAGYTHGRWRYDAAYQAQLPATRSIGTSGLRAGEYDNSRIRITTQSLTVTTHLRF